MESDFQVRATHAGGYRFTIDFQLPGVPPLLADEPPPLGAAEGPNPARLLAGAVANCLAASLVFCLQKRRIAIDGMAARAEGTMVRNERGRYRIRELRIHLDADVPEDDRDALERCREVFQDFCIVTESVREGIDVHVDVSPPPRSAGAAGAKDAAVASAPT